MQIVKYPDKRLKQKSLEVGLIWFLILRLYMPELIKLMLDNKGIGLAGVQVGILKRFFIMIDELGNVLSIYNPIIHKYGNHKRQVQEGCLSLPNRQRMKIRSVNIEVSFLDENFKMTHKKLYGANAIVFQHEYDHLDGKLIIDK